MKIPIDWNWGKTERITKESRMYQLSKKTQTWKLVRNGYL